VLERLLVAAALLYPDALPWLYPAVNPYGPSVPFRKGCNFKAQPDKAVKEIMGISQYHGDPTTMSISARQNPGAGVRKYREAV
jgi:hypothetical protein